MNKSRPDKAQTNDREARLKAALKANIARRKAQAKARDAAKTKQDEQKE